MENFALVHSTVSVSPWTYGIVIWQYGRTKEAQLPDLYQAALDLLLPGIRPYGLVTTISQVRNGTALKQCYKIAPVMLTYS